MVVKNILLANESYTHGNWLYKDVSVGFSRLYYIIDGEAYYEENGKKVRFKKGYLYLTPVRHPYTVSENPENKLYHTYCHVTTLPEVSHFTEIEVKNGTPLADAVDLWRKYVCSKDSALICDTVQFLLSRISEQISQKNTVAVQTKRYIDTLKANTLDMQSISLALGYTREHITRTFFSVYKATPKQYFNTRRMNVAADKLCEGEKVKVVADKLGFASPYSFSKAFKKHFGVSPRQYTDQLQS